MAKKLLLLKVMHLQLKEKRLLLSEGHELEVLSVGRPLREILAERRAEAGGESEGEDAVPAGYPDLAGVYAGMTAAATNYPSNVWGGTCSRSRSPTTSTSTRTNRRS